jgi:hypothetical protein
MNERLQEQMKQFERVAGVQACGLLLADQTHFCLGFDPAFTSEGLQNACAGVAETIRALARQGLPPVRAQWVYEHFLLHCLPRPNGSCLVVFCTRKPKQLDVAALERQITEFQAAEG